MSTLFPPPLRLDPRKTRTRAALRDAMVRLILERGYENLTIQDITDAADLRRATFYLHYKDKEELLLAMLTTLLDELICNMEEIDKEVLTPAAEQEIYERILRHGAANADLYRAILGGSGVAPAIRYVREYTAAAIRVKFLSQISEAELPVPIDVLANFCATLKMQMVIWWLEQGMPYPVEDMAAMCMRLTLGGALGALEVKQSR